MKRGNDRAGRKKEGRGPKEDEREDEEEDEEAACRRGVDKKTRNSSLPHRRTGRRACEYVRVVVPCARALACV